MCAIKFLRVFAQVYDVPLPFLLAFFAFYCDSPGFKDVGAGFIIRKLHARIWAVSSVSLQQQKREATLLYYIHLSIVGPLKPFTHRNHA